MSAATDALIQAANDLSASVDALAAKPHGDTPETEAALAQVSQTLADIKTKIDAM